MAVLEQASCKEHVGIIQARAGNAARVGVHRGRPKRSPKIAVARRKTRTQRRAPFAAGSKRGATSSQKGQRRLSRFPKAGKLLSPMTRRARVPDDFGSRVMAPGYELVEVLFAMRLDGVLDSSETSRPRAARRGGRGRRAGRRGRARMVLSLRRLAWLQRIAAQHSTSQLMQGARGPGIRWSLGVKRKGTSRWWCSARLLGGALRDLGSNSLLLLLLLLLATGCTRQAPRHSFSFSLPLPAGVVSAAAGLAVPFFFFFCPSKSASGWASCWAPQ